MVTVYWPDLQLYVGDTLAFDGEIYHIDDRAGSDRFLVSGDPLSGQEEKHIDWFGEMAEKSDVVNVIKKSI